MDPEHRTTTEIARNTLQELARDGKPPTPLNYARTYARHADLPIDTLLSSLLELPEVFAHIEEDTWTLKQLELLKNFLPQAVLLPEQGILTQFSSILEETLSRNRNFSQEVVRHRKEFNSTIHHLNELIAQIHVTMHQTSSRLERNLNRLNTIKTLDEARPVLSDIVEQSQLLLSKLKKIGDEFQEAHKNLMNSTIEANMDPLTGILNRRGFMKRLESFVRKNIVLLIFDLDHFKELNDRKGHRHGDQVLQKISTLVTHHLEDRPNVFCRWGGDEFLILFPDNSLDGISQFAENLRTAVLTDSERETSPQNPSRHVTLSIGMSAGFFLSSDLFDTFYNLADQALYIAKKEGKNRVRAIHLEDQGSNSPRHS